MSQLSEFLFSPLLDFIPTNSPSKNTERPDELDILLETLSKSDIQLLDRGITMTSGMTNTNKSSALLLPILPICCAIARAPEIPTTPLR